FRRDAAGEQNSETVYSDLLAADEDGYFVIVPLHSCLTSCELDAGNRLFLVFVSPWA
ncbi:MAG: hypothetical protein Greene041679_518, partial [Parcubacteria group bacterium Greene0416_79]